MIIKVLNDIKVDNREEKAVNKEIEQLESEKKQLALNFEEAHNKSFDEMDIKKLAELRADITKADRQIIANKLKQHHIAEPKGVQYGKPRFFTK